MQDQVAILKVQLQREQTLRRTSEASVDVLTRRATEAEKELEPLRHSTAELKETLAILQGQHSDTLAQVDALTKHVAELSSRAKVRTWVVR